MSKTEEFKNFFTSVDKAEIKHGDYIVNLLGLAAVLSSTAVFIYIHKELGASIDHMEDLFETQKISALNFICSKNNTELLDYFLPYYDARNDEGVIFEQFSMSLDLTNKEKRRASTMSTYTPIHKACELGNMGIIANTYRYFKDRVTVPYKLDIDYQDEITGENCALIACRTGNYSMIRFLHTTCHANFFILNKFGENAIQILVARNKRRKLRNFKESFMYLINNIKIDYTYNYEETLLLLVGNKATEIYEKKLKEKGIIAKKSELEKKNTPAKVECTKTKEESSLERYDGRVFNFKEIYSNIIIDHSHDGISEIHDESHNTPFISCSSDASYG